MGSIFLYKISVDLYSGPTGNDLNYLSLIVNFGREVFHLHPPAALEINRKKLGHFRAGLPYVDLFHPASRDADSLCPFSAGIMIVVIND